MIPWQYELHVRACYIALHRVINFVNGGARLGDTFAFINNRPILVLLGRGSERTRPPVNGPVYAEILLPEVAGIIARLDLSAA